MTPHTVWIGGSPFAEQLQAAAMHRPKTRKAGATRPVPARKPRTKKLPPGRPPSERCASCLFSTFRKDIKNHADRRGGTAVCTLKEIEVHQNDGLACGDWEYWKGKQ